MAIELPTLTEIEAVVRKVLDERLGPAAGAGGASLTTDQAAAVAGVTRKTVLSWINEGIDGRRLPAGRRGKRRIVSRADLEAFLAGDAPPTSKAQAILRRLG